MRRLAGFLSYLFANFGPLITFYGVDHFFGLRPALVCSLAVTLLEVWNLKFRKKIELGGFFKFSVAMTLVFGSLDLLLAEAVFLKYEAALMNLIFALYFAGTVPGQQPIMIEFARKSGKFTRELTPEFVIFFRYLTALWVAYFLAKAGFYFWRAHQQGSTLGQLLLVRLLVGNGSLAAMIALSAFGSRPLFKVLSRAGLLNAKTVLEGENLGTS